MRALFRLNTTCRLSFLLLLGTSLDVQCSTAADTDRGIRDEIRAARSDDGSLHSLQAAVEQLTTLTQSLQAQLAEAQQSISHLKVQAGQLSKQVAFTVHFRHDDGVHGVGVANKSPLRFDSVVLNAGGGYNTNTGVFTAPASGLYCFFVNVMGVSALGSVGLAVDLEGNTIDYVYANQDTDQGASMVTAHMTQGQQLSVRHNYGQAVRGAMFTVFSGFLVQPDHT